MKRIDSNIKHPAYWNEMERLQKAELEKLKFVVVFNHNRQFQLETRLNKKGEKISVKVPAPKQLMRPGRKMRLFVSMTIAKLYKKDEYKKAKQRRTIKSLNPISKGLARCSHLDQFNRQVGRVIATERALANLQE